MAKDDTKLTADQKEFDKAAAPLLKLLDGDEYAKLIGDINKAADKLAAYPESYVRAKRLARQLKRAGRIATRERP